MSGRFLVKLGAAAAGAVLCGGAAQAATLSGVVRVEAEKRLRNLVVYLEPSAAPAAPVPAPPVRVYQRGRAFSPRTAVVVRGGAVEFVNDEEREIDHNVYSLSRGNKFDIGLVARGGTRRVTFDTPGVVKYFCSVHKIMEGVIVVVPAPHFAVLRRPGRFAIRDVPPGDWRVKVSAAHRRYRAEPVTVRVGAAPVDGVVVRLRRKR